MKKILFLVLILFSISAFCDRGGTDNQSIFNDLADGIKSNSDLLEKLNHSFAEKNIDIFYSQWKKMLDKKCNWVSDNLDLISFGQEDKFSPLICKLDEQYPFIYKLLALAKKLDIKIKYDFDYNEYQKPPINQKQWNVYFNILTKKFADDFCHSFYVSNEENECVNDFMLRQYTPSGYDFKIIPDKAYLFNSPSEKDKSSMYLVKDDKIDLLQYQEGFYEIEYTTKKNKIIKKWLYCSAIDACE